MKENYKNQKELMSYKFSLKFYYNLQILIIVLFSFSLYVNTLSSDYTLDDTLLITQNRYTMMGFSGIKQIMNNDLFSGFLNKNLSPGLPGGRYRPLSQVIFAFENQLFGLNPFIGHLVNILLYSFMCILIFILLNKIFVNVIPVSDKSIITRPHQHINAVFTFPFIITLLFAAHPLHTEVVANIKGSDEILCLIFVALTFLATIKYIDTLKAKSEERREKSFNLQIFNLAKRSHEHFNLKNNIANKSSNLQIFLISLFFLFALLSKENAITFIAIIPLTFFLFRKINFKDHIILLIALLIPLGIYSILRYNALGTIFITNNYDVNLLNNPFINTDSIQKYSTTMLTWGKYLLLLIFPHPLTHDYYPKQIPIIGWNDYRAIIPLIIYSALFIYALFVIIRNKFSHFQIFTFSNLITAYGILFYLITFSIQSNLLFNIGTFMNERFMFISLLGFCLIVAYILRFKVKDLELRIILLFLIILAYSNKTISRNAVWKDNFTLFTTDVKTSSESAKCNISAGYMYYLKAQKETNTINKDNMLQKAIDFYNRGENIYPLNVEGWQLLGKAYFEMKEYQNTKICYENVINIYPKYFSVYNKLGELFGKYLNNIDSSLFYINKAYALNPNDVDVLENLGISFALLKDYNKSLEFFNKALKVAPLSPHVYKNLEAVYRIMGDTLKEAEIHKKYIMLKNRVNK